MKYPLMLLLTMLSLTASAQPPSKEIGQCGSGTGDEDGDGKWNCADPDCACGSAFPCTERSTMYQIRDAHRLWQWEPGSTDWVHLVDWNGGSNPPETNAIGYNAHDGYIYGMRNSTSTHDSWNHVVKLQLTPNGGQGYWTDLRLSGSGGLNRSVTNGSGQILGEIPYNALEPFPQKLVVGDFDLDGFLYVTYPASTKMWVIDMDAYLANTLPQWAEVAFNFGTTGLTSISCSDWAFLPATGRLYGALTGGDQIVSVDRTTGDVVLLDIDVPGDMGCTGAFGAAFADNASAPQLYFFCNGGGSFFKTSSANWGALTGGTFSAEQIPTTLDTMGLNDGASCSLSTNSCPCCNENEEREQRSSAATHPGTLDRSTTEEKQAAKRATLHQNRPNPFDERTVISYEIFDKDARKASISIFRMNGDLVHTYPITVDLKGELVIEAKAMQPGMYLFTMLLDDQEIDTKRMLLLE